MNTNTFDLHSSHYKALRMKKLFLPVLLLISLLSHAQSVEGYFESIRNNEARLTAFMQLMPKGGDLHHHYTGSVYAETYVQAVIAKDFWINPAYLMVMDTKPDTGKYWVRFSSLPASDIPALKEALMTKWSVKNYNGTDPPSDKQFFNAFGYFSPATRISVDNGLLELKKRAQSEQVSYIETMFMTIDNRKTDLGNCTSVNDQLRKAARGKEEEKVARILDSLFKVVMAKDGALCAKTFNDSIARQHKRLMIDDATFTLRYMNYVSRNSEPADVIKGLVIAFESANTSPLIVGVNLVAPENGEVSMKDYWLHMQMLKFCHSKFPAVNISLHAGELVMGMVKPEELTWHIGSAVWEGHAQRIGHGVDIAYEKDCYGLLGYMSKNNIAIEINLFSNEFILKVKDGAHPFSMYRDFNVPILICTDDAGILRSDLTRQYVLLAMRYKDVTYENIKSYVYNSMRYSFIKEPVVKKALETKLDNAFRSFEGTILQLSKPGGTH
ncbi:MAG: adenosine deaminase [Bacteroidia bacterium]